MSTEEKREVNTIQRIESENTKVRRKDKEKMNTIQRIERSLRLLLLAL